MALLRRCPRVSLNGEAWAATRGLRWETLQAGGNYSQGDDAGRRPEQPWPRRHKASDQLTTRGVGPIALMGRRVGGAGSRNLLLMVRHPYFVSCGLHI